MPEKNNEIAELDATSFVYKLFEDESGAGDLSQLNFGRISAEDERANLPRYFVEPYDFQRVHRGEDWLVVGPKGSGKSAIGVKLMSDPPGKTLVVDISPDEVGWSEIRTYSDCGIAPSQAKKNAWLSVFLAHMCRNVEAFVGKEYPVDIVEQLLREAGAKLPPRMSLQEIGIHFKALSARFGKGESPEGVDFGALVRAVKESIRILDHGLEADDSQIRLLVDRLDEHWAAGTQDDLTLEGLLLAAREVAFISDNIRVQIFLRSDIWARLTFHDKDKFKSNLLEIRWSDGKLIDLVGERVCYSTGHKGPPILGFYWAFPWDVSGVVGQGGRRDVDRLILSSINKRPRDLLYVCDRAAYHREDSSKAISPAALLQALKDYSQERLDNVIHAEAARTVPEFAKLVRELFGSRMKVRWRTLEERIKSAGELYASDTRKYLRYLLEYEILGRVDGDHTSYFSDDPGILDREVSLDSTFAFHPSLRASMQLKNIYGGIE